MRALGNLLLSLAAGVLMFLLSFAIVYGLLTVSAHGEAPGIGVNAGPIFVAVLIWPLHLLLGLIATGITFVVTRAKDARRAERELAQAFRDADSG